MEQDILLSSIEASPPLLLMEEDHEAEVAVVKPILDNLIDEAVEQSQFNSLSELFMRQIENASEAIERQAVQGMASDIVLEAVAKAVSDSEARNAEDEKPNNSGMGTITISSYSDESSDSETEEAAQRPLIEASEFSRVDAVGGIEDVDTKIEASEEVTSSASVTRKVAKVMPYAGPQSEVMILEEAAGGDGLLEVGSNIVEQPEDPLAILDVFSVTEEQEQQEQNEPVGGQSEAGTSRPLLRLKNFAVDPAAWKASPASSTNISVGLTPTSTWHQTEAAPATQAVPATQHVGGHAQGSSRQSSEKIGFNFANIKNEMEFVYVLKGKTVNVNEEYLILSSTNNFHLKLFVHVTSLDKIPDRNRWTDVLVKFVPDRENPTDCEITFRSWNYRQLNVPLPFNYYICGELIGARKNFVLSVNRVAKVNTSYITYIGWPMISHAITRRTRHLWAIDLNKGSGHYAATLLYHLYNKPMGTWLTADMRSETRQHLKLLSDAAPVPTDTTAMELYFFKESKGQLDKYRAGVNHYVNQQRNGSSSASIIVNSSTHCRPLPLASSTAVSSVPQQLICNICDYEFSPNSSTELVLSHLARMHFSARLAKYVSLSPGKCNFHGCHHTWSDRLRDQIVHVGVHHRMSEFYAQKLEKDMSSYSLLQQGSSFKCPFDICLLASTNYDKPSKFINHLFSHMADLLTSEVSKLQKVQGLTATHCPLDGCPMRFDKPLYVVRHVSIDHCGLLPYLDVALKNMKVDRVKNWKYQRGVMLAFQKCILGTEFECGVTSCRMVFGSHTELSFHQACKHHSSVLVQMFSENSIPIPGDLTKRGCPVCMKPFDLFYGAIHMRIMHNLKGPQEGGDHSTISQKMTTPTAGEAGETSEAISVVPVIESVRSEAAAVIPKTYKCPLCFKLVDCPDGKSTTPLLEHILLQHKLEVFTRMLEGIRPNCPDRQCRVVFHTSVDDMSLHVFQSHPDFIWEFVRSHMPHNFSPTNCLVQEEQHSIYMEKYRDFCKARNADPFNCEVIIINVFLNFIYTQYNLSAKVLEYVVLEISKRHQWVGGGTKTLMDHPGIAHTLATLKMNTKVNIKKPIMGQSICLPNRVHESLNPTTPAATSTEAVDTTIVQSTSGTSENQGEKEVKKSEVFYCGQCNLGFQTVNASVAHTIQEEHWGIGCRYCQVMFDKKKDLKTMEKHIVLHTYSVVHLYNRWRAIHCDKRNTTPPLRTGAVAGGGGQLLDRNRCEVCSMQVDDLTSHATARRHLDNAFIINHYVAHCDLRGVCPVDCPVEEVTFYLETIYPRTRGMPDQIKKMENINIHQVLLVLTRIHDPLEGGVDLTGDMAVSEHLSLLLTGQLAQTVAKYICYTCPYLSGSLEDMKDHLSGSLHKTKDQAIRLRCEACNKIFRKGYHLFLHVFSREHIRNFHGLSKHETGQPILAMRESDKYCYLCEEVTVNLMHLTQSKHLLRFKAVSHYLSYCKENQLHPVDCPNTKITEYLKQFQDDPKTLLAIDLIRSDTTTTPSVGKSGEASREKEGDHQFDSYGLPAKEEEEVKTCPICFIKFDHCTYLLYHLLHIHGEKPEPFIARSMQRAKEKPLQTCSRCTKKCLSPVVMALHHDRHMVQKKHLKCSNCQKNYISPAAYYSTDTCKKNTLPERVKKEVEAVILKAVLRSPFTGIIGCANRFAKYLRTEDKVARQSKQTPEPTVEEEEDKDEDYTPDYSEDEEDKTTTTTTTTTEVESSQRDKNKDKFYLPDIDSNEELGEEEEENLDVMDFVDNMLSGGDTEEYMKRACVTIPAKERELADTYFKVEPLVIKLSSKPGPKTRKRKISSSTEPSLSAKRAKTSPPKVKQTAKKNSTAGPKANKKQNLMAQGNDYGFFCRDCEGCGKGCDHLGHSRKLLSDLNGHIQATGHGRFQPVENVVRIRQRYHIQDLAYHPKFGNLVRKLYKKYALAARDSGKMTMFDFDNERRCKAAKCNFSTISVVQMMRHIREEHLSKFN